jgi:hypothetical protein
MTLVYGRKEENLEQEQMPKFYNKGIRGLCNL